MHTTSSDRGATWLQAVEVEARAIDRTSTAERVADVLRRRITEGDLPPGTRLQEELLVDAIVRVAQLVSDHPQIVELDLNPVIVSTDGCWVTDARVVLSGTVHAEGALRRLE